MIKYSSLNSEEKQEIIDEIRTIIPKIKAKYGDEPEYTIKEVKDNLVCCACLMPWYNCICSQK